MAGRFAMLGRRKAGTSSDSYSAAALRKGDLLTAALLVPARRLSETIHPDDILAAPS